MPRGAKKGSRVGSERWQIEQLQKGESVVFMGRKSESISGTLWRYFNREEYIVNQGWLVLLKAKHDPEKCSVVTRK